MTVVARREERPSPTEVHWHDTWVVCRCLTCGAHQEFRQYEAPANWLDEVSVVSFCDCSTDSVVPVRMIPND